MAGLIASLLAGCGGGGSSSSSQHHRCRHAKRQRHHGLCRHHEPAVRCQRSQATRCEHGSVIDLKQAILNIAVSAQPLDSSASQATGQAQKDLKAATNKFESQLSSAVAQPVSQRVVTVGKALSQFENALSQTKAQFNCNQ
jgi:elongation factor P hydroxylase